MDLNVVQERGKPLESRFCFLVLSKQLSTGHCEMQLRTLLLLHPSQRAGVQVKEYQLKCSSEHTNPEHNFPVKAGTLEGSGK